MKQLLITKSVGYAASYSAADFTALTAGSIALFKLSDYSKLTSAPTENFGIVVGGDRPFVIPEVDFKTLQAVKAPYVAGTTFEGTIEVPETVVEGEDYTVIVVKKGMNFNRRSNYSAVVRCGADDTSATIAEKLVEELNNKVNGAESDTALNITASASDAEITIEGNEVGEDFAIVGADALTGVEPTITTAGIPAFGDKKYMLNLARECAQNRGFNYLAEDGKELYPGYPPVLDASTYTVYTLRFAVPRAASKTRDEVVSQIVHIAVPTGGAAISSLDTILGTGS